MCNLIKEQWRKGYVHVRDTKLIDPDLLWQLKKKKKKMAVTAVNVW